MISIKQQEIHDFLTTFFKETNCEIYESTSYSLSVQLTVDIDKRIMNRPFYWQYVEATGAEPHPSQLHLITNRNEAKEGIYGKIIHFGSPLLNNIFRATKDLGSFVKMYEEAEQHETLTPWLSINYKVSYQCHKTKESIYSFGMNLINGEIWTEFHDYLCSLKLSTENQNNAYCIPPIISSQRALAKLDETIQHIIKQDDHSWAEEAKEILEKEIEILDYFYQDEEQKNDRYEIEKKAIEERYKPRIQVEIINGGIFYLK